MSRVQVSFTSPNPFGPSPAGGRPSFNNIGAHIDLGPQKPADQLLFISSTVSNKIVIGSEEEPTTPLPSLPTRPAKIDFSSGRNFPSFPIRGDGAPSIKSKLDFSRRNKPTFKFAKPSTKYKRNLFSHQTITLLLFVIDEVWPTKLVNFSC